MACSLIGGIVAGCRDGSGGIKEIKIKVIQSVATVAANFTVTSGDVAIASGSRSLWYTYYIEKETASLTDTSTVNVQNGTRFWTPEIKIVINKLRAQMRNEIEVLAQVAVQIAVRDLNDNYWLVGKENGLDMISSVGQTGVARGDRSGYEITFQGKESIPICSMTSAVYDTLVT